MLNQLEGLLKRQQEDVRAERRLTAPLDDGSHSRGSSDDTPQPDVDRRRLDPQHRPRMQDLLDSQDEREAPAGSALEYDPDATAPETDALDTAAVELDAPDPDRTPSELDAYRTHDTPSELDAHAPDTAEREFDAYGASPTVTQSDAEETAVSAEAEVEDSPRLETQAEETAGSAAAEVEELPRLETPAEETAASAEAAVEAPPQLETPAEETAASAEAAVEEPPQLETPAEEAAASAEAAVEAPPQLETQAEEAAVSAATEFAEPPRLETQFETTEQAEGAHMTRRLTTRLGQLLVDADLLSEPQLQSALRRQQETGERLGAVLVNEGYIDEPALLSILASQYGVPAAGLDDVNLDTALAKLIPHDMAQRYLLVPLALHADAVDVAMVDPTDFVAMAHVRFATGLRPNVFITTVTAAQRAIAKLYAEEDSETVAPPRDPREAVKRMILDRDSMLLAADEDPRKFYELAASIDVFVDEIFRNASGSG